MENQMMEAIKRTGLDEKMISEILNERSKKRTYIEIRKEFKISEDNLKIICNIFKLSGIEHRNFGALTKKDIDLITNLYNSGCSIRQINREYGYDRTTIRKHVDLRKTSKIERKKKKVTDVIEWRKRVKQKLVDYKGGCCEICGYNKNIKALQFHHKNPNEKDFSISGKSYSYERQKSEVDKCILVCANCHIEIHDKMSSTEPH